MKYHGQNLNQPVVIVTASTGKTATATIGTAVHSAFNLPLCKPEQTRTKVLLQKTIR